MTTSQMIDLNVAFWLLQVIALHLKDSLSELEWGLLPDEVDKRGNVSKR